MITLKDYVEKLNDFIKENPETLELMVVYGVDDEGNDYKPIVYTPSKGKFDKNEFIPFVNFEDYDLNKEDVNSVCIN